MDKWFVILLGALVASLYVPPIVMPAKNRELARKVIANPKILHRFGFAMVAIGIMAMLLSGKPDLHHRILLVGGVIETLAGIVLLTRPAFFVSQLQFVSSKPLMIWIIRGMLKFTLGVAIALWGIIFF